MHLQHSPSETPPPQDNVFLELLFDGVCQHIRERRGESFVQRTKRWIEALSFMTALQPRNQQEWLQAADVTTKQFEALHSLDLYRRRGRSGKQRLAHATAFIGHAKATQEARLRYELLRGVPAD